MTSRKETIQVIKHAIASRDSGLLKAIIAYKPTEYIQIIQNEGLIDLGNLELAALLLEMGVEMGPSSKSDRRKYARNMDGYQIGKLLTAFGFERAKPLLKYIPSEISEPYELVAAFYQDSVEALEWLRDSDIRNLLDDICINEPIFNDPDPAKVAVFFTCPSGSTQKWGKDIYQDIDLMELMDTITNNRRNPERTPEQKNWEQNALKVIDLFIQNVQTDEEYEIMDYFVEKHPEFELLERSSPPEA